MTICIRGEKKRPKLFPYSLQLSKVEHNDLDILWPQDLFIGFNANIWNKIKIVLSIYERSSKLKHLFCFLTHNEKLICLQNLGNTKKKKKNPMTLSRCWRLPKKACQQNHDTSRRGAWCSLAEDSFWWNTSYPPVTKGIKSDEKYGQGKNCLVLWN